MQPQGPWQPPYQQPSYPPHYPSQHPRQNANQYWGVAPDQYAKGKQIVFWSRMLLLASGLVFVASCGITIAAVPQALPGLALATILIVAAAAVGSIGRGV